MSEPQWTRGPWYVGSQNAQLYIINKPPRPSTDYAADIPELTVIAKVYYVHTAEPYNARLIAAAPSLYDSLDTAPVLSKYHGTRGFESERFIADYEAWSATKRAIMAGASKP